MVPQPTTHRMRNLDLRFGRPPVKSALRPTESVRDGARGREDRSRSRWLPRLSRLSPAVVKPPLVAALHPVGAQLADTKVADCLEGIGAVALFHSSFSVIRIPNAAFPDERSGPCRPAVPIERPSAKQAHYKLVVNLAMLLEEPEEG